MQKFIKILIKFGERRNSVRGEKAYSNYTSLLSTYVYQALCYALYIYIMYIIVYNIYLYIFNIYLMYII